MRYDGCSTACLRKRSPAMQALALVLVAAGCSRLLPAAEVAEERSLPPLSVDADFPGGNILVEKVVGDEIHVCQDLRDTAGPWFYWYFRVRGAAGRELTVHFTKGDVLGVRGPALSLDGGRTWSWLGAERVHRTSFRYAVPANAEEVRFSFGIPYLEANLREFLDRHATHPALNVGTLCRTPQDRDVELLRLGKLQGEPDYRVLLTARHHACEALASFALEGVLESVLADQADGAWLRDHVEFLAVPLMDKDGVENGDQGKNRRPHDHNRDYIQKIYPSVRELTQRVNNWSDGKLAMAIDLHCPHIRGPHNEVIYCVGGRDAANWLRVTQFAAVLQEVRTGPLPYHTADNLPFGQAWNTGTGDPKLQSFSAWAAELPGMRVATTIEIPYANASGQEVTADAARAFGQDVARAIRVYLEQLAGPSKDERNVRDPRDQRD